MNYDIVESNIRDELKDLKRRKNRNIERLKEYEDEEKLSKHGMWSKGYFTAKRAVLEDEIYFLESIIEKIDTINSFKFLDLLNVNTNLKPLSLAEEIDIELNKKCKLISEE